ncbi:peptide/nickel transport system substrate-binding protein [Pelosinus propionicus DSM 13327]|uniref:Peptide/nickel transport system substrate-binding protein n=1 Tax=Pelosinus propionicus DSM 13327 TaxID=1123291 RepID=A0A1I4MWU6_9FIRM|nr:peptide ABC transporter substrate-binding protein [Pelosinus propionicus]SFM07567.1 peptide/nickel transport system substrate-binding protein [Pelosinus propionicus DSM 13327]
MVDRRAVALQYERYKMNNLVLLRRIVMVIGRKCSRILCLLILLALTSGCNSKSLPVSPKNEIKPGGQLVYGSLQEPNTLNPFLSDLLATAEVSSLIFSSLVINDAKGEWLPDLALEVPTLQNGGVSPDGLTVKYKLRPGVTWHDGKAFTSEDVKFTWQMIMNSGVNVMSREGYDKIRTIDTPDSYTVVIQYREFYPSYLTLFKSVLPKHILEKEDINKSSFNRAPIGTGPFKLKEWHMSESLLLEANTAYYRGKPTLDSILYKVIPDTNVMLSQLKVGALDIVTNIPLSLIDQIKGVEGVQVLNTPNMIWEHVDFNLDNTLFQDVKVRQAIALGIDRQALIANVLKNSASTAVSDQSPLSWGFNSAIMPAAHNVAAARELLSQAGWQQGTDGIFAKDGRKLSFSLSVPMGNKARELAAQAISYQLKEVGIQAEVKIVDGKKFFDDLLKNRQFETAMYAWVAGVDPNNFNLWNSKKIPNRNNQYAGQNYSGWRNAEIDALTDQGIHTVDIENRKQISFRIQELIIQECPIIPLYFRHNIDVVKKTVINYQANPTPSGNLWNAWQWGFTSK